MRALLIPDTLEGYYVCDFPQFVPQSFIIVRQKTCRILMLFIHPDFFNVFSDLSISGEDLRVIFVLGSNGNNLNSSFMTAKSFRSFSWLIAVAKISPIY